MSRIIKDTAAIDKIAKSFSLPGEFERLRSHDQKTNETANETICRATTIKKSKNNSTQNQQKKLENVDEIYLNNSNSKKRFSGTFFIDFQKKKLFKKNEILRGAKLQFTFSRKREWHERRKNDSGSDIPRELKSLIFCVAHTIQKQANVLPKTEKNHSTQKQKTEGKAKVWAKL